MLCLSWGKLGCQAFAAAQACFHLVHPASIHVLITPWTVHC